MMTEQTKQTAVWGAFTGGADVKAMRALVVAAAVVAVMLSLPVAAQDFEKGVEAFKRGDYRFGSSQALVLVRPVTQSLMRKAS